MTIRISQTAADRIKSLDTPVRKSLLDSLTEDHLSDGRLMVNAGDTQIRSLLTGDFALTYEVQGTAQPNFLVLEVADADSPQGAAIKTLSEGIDR